MAAVWNHLTAAAEGETRLPMRYEKKTGKIWMSHHVPDAPAAVESS